MLLYLLFSTLILISSFFVTYLIFCCYINRYHNSKDVLSRLLDSVYSGISIFYAPHSPYLPGFKNIKLKYVVKSVWNTLYIVITAIALYFEIPTFFSSIPLCLQILGILAERKQKHTMEQLFLFEREKGLAEDESYNIFVKIYATSYYYQIIMTISLLPLSLLLLYIGFKMNVL